MPDYKTLCLSLVKAETEEEIIQILKKTGHWDNESDWHFVGDNENNFSTIGNQQSRADAALVEKIINSVDAVLLREAYRKNIDPKGSDAPKSTQDAVEKLFEVKEGKLGNLSSSKRSELAKNIRLIATGSQTKPNYIIADLGEGQGPEAMPGTFLSLNSSNKLRIPFVQGKFNMGGTGSLQFCGRHNLQLILTKRDPNIVNGSKNDWGFTLIRREDPRQGVKSSVFKYLRPSGQIPSFSANTLNILPGEYPNPYAEPMQFGSFIKLYNFDLRGLKTNVKFDLYYRLSSLLPSIALPVTMYERRKGYRANNYEAILSGLNVRLDEDKSNNLEDGFPSSSEINIEGEKMLVSVYAFKKGKRENYTKNDGVLFTNNGQTHGFIGKSFFETRTVDMSYLSDSILVFVDCSQVSGRTREDLFMNSRDRLREGPVLAQIKKEVGKIINSHPGLRTLRENRRRDELNKNLADSKPLAETLEKIIQQSPSLASLFSLGTRINSPFNLTGVRTEAEEFHGKKYPTYFKPTNGVKTGSISRPVNHDFRVAFETDAENEYFIRDENPGELKVYIEDQEANDYSFNLWNGKANITLEFPKNTQSGQKVKYQIVVDGEGLTSPFKHKFIVNATEFVDRPSHPGGPRPKPPSDERGQERERPSSLALPTITEIHKEEWDEHGFNQYSALEIKTFEGKYDFFVNADNSYLLNEIKINPRMEPEITRVRFINALVLVSLALLNRHERIKSELDSNESSESVFDQIAGVTEALAPIICPMIDKLGSI